MILEDIGEGGDALLCKTNLTTCCRTSDTGEMGNALGNWFFPNGSRVPSSRSQSLFFRSRGEMAVHLHRKRGEAEGIYRCVIPDAMNVTRTIYIGVYSASTQCGEEIWVTSMCVLSMLKLKESGDMFSQKMFGI